MKKSLLRVHDLIAQLQALPQEAVVVLNGGEYYARRAIYDPDHLYWADESGRLACAVDIEVD